MGRHPILRVLFALLAACSGLPGAAQAAQIYLSTTNAASLAGLGFRDGDIVRYDTVTGVATLFFDEDLFSANENIDAFHLRNNGNILLSTATGATLGGLTFRDGDVVEYDPVGGVATLFFSEDLFTNSANIDGFSLLTNGQLVLSTTTSETLGGLFFRNGDLVAYDPVSGTASLFLDEDLFTADEDIDAVRVLGDGTILLSTANAATIGGLSFLDGDVIRYDRNTDTAVLEFSESLFAANENLDGLFAPEPGTGLLLALGLAGLARRRQGAPRG
jgi:hypothetical protein